MGPTISMQHHWHLRAPGVLPMKNQVKEEPGPPMANLDGTWDRHLSITGATKSTFQKPKERESVTPWNSSPPIARCHTSPQMMQPFTPPMT